MIWSVEIADELEAEWDQFPVDVQDEILAHGRLLEQFWSAAGQAAGGYLEGIELQQYEGIAL